jgi:benzoyl-CoA reductase subunit C
MSEESQGLSLTRNIYLNRTQRIKELKNAGKKLIGYPCAYVPLEILTAADIVPFRTYGDIREPITEADRALPASFCPMMRTCLDCALKGKYDFLDGMVTVHSCDPQEKTARVWQSYVSHKYFHFLDMPSSIRPESIEYFKLLLNDFKKTLESFTGKKLSAVKLKAAIKSHNQQRALVQELYELTKPVPPLISGTELVQVIKALMSLPVSEGNEMLNQVIVEVKKRTHEPKKKPVRLLIWSSTLDDVDIMQVFEDKANVVMDETCGGIRAFRGKVKLTADPLDGLADYYMKEITCARTFRQATLGETKKDYTKDLQSRFGYFKGILRDWKINGAVLLLVRYCDPFAFEMPSLKDYFDSIGIPSTYIEYDYTIGTLAQLRTRVEAFLETVN